MTRRLRLLQVIVQPVAVWDDGETITPGPQLSPLTIATNELDGFPKKLRTDFEQLRQQVEAAEAPKAKSNQATRRKSP